MSEVDYFTWREPSAFDERAMELRRRYGPLSTADGMTYTLKDFADKVKPDGGTQARYYSELLCLPVTFVSFDPSMDDYLFSVGSPGMRRHAQELNDVLDGKVSLFNETVPDTLSGEIAEDQERIADMARAIRPGFVSYRQAKREGLVDEDPWPTTAEIIAAHSAKVIDEAMRENIRRDLARVEARAAFREGVRVATINTVKLGAIGVAAAIGLGLFGALSLAAFTFVSLRIPGGSERVGELAIIFIGAAILGSLIASAGSRR